MAVRVGGHFAQVVFYARVHFAQAVILYTHRRQCSGNVGFGLPQFVFFFLCHLFSICGLYNYRLFLAGLHYLFGKLHQRVGFVGTGQQFGGQS